MLYLKGRAHCQVISHIKGINVEFEGRKLLEKIAKKKWTNDCITKITYKIKTLPSPHCLTRMNQNFLIIGGSSGIGLKLAELLTSKNHHVIDASRRSDELPFNALTDTLDISTLPDPLHGLVYCPGSITLKPFHRLTDQEFLDDFHLNILGAVKAIRSVLPLLKIPEQSSIVLFSTVAVSQGMPFHASVATAKGAVEGLAKSLAAEFAPKIRVNVIAPSLTDTPLAAKLLSTEEKKRASGERHPLKRIGTAEDIANLAGFLLSSESSWITGQIIQVDGGISSLTIR